MTGNYTLDVQDGQVYGDDTQKTINGDVTVQGSLTSAETVTLKNLAINGTLTIDIAQGHINLDSVTAATTDVQSSGNNSLVFKSDSSTDLLRVQDADGVRIAIESDNVTIQTVDVEPADGDSEVLLEGDFKESKVNVKKSAKIKAKSLKLNRPIVIETASETDEVSIEGDLENLEGGVEVKTKTKLKLKNVDRLKKLIAKADVELVDETDQTMSVDAIAEKIDAIDTVDGVSEDLKQKVQKAQVKRIEKCKEKLAALDDAHLTDEKDIEKAEKTLDRIKDIMETVQDEATKAELNDKIHEKEAKVEDKKQSICTDTIMEIQGAAFKSPLEGKKVKKVKGIVTQKSYNSFYIQDSSGDGNDATSDAILVYAGSSIPSDLKLGDEVEIGEAVVAEFYAYNKAWSSKEATSTTQLKNPKNIKILSSGNKLPAATLLGDGGRAIPTGWVDNDGMESFDANEDGIDFWESLEGMRVTVNDGLIVSPKVEYGEFAILADGGAASAAKLTVNDGIKLSSYDDNPEIITVYHPATKSAYKSGEELDYSVGDSFEGAVTGLITYSFGKYKLDFIEELPTIKDCGRTRSSEKTHIKGDSNHLTVASYNLENFSIANGGDRERAAAFGESIVKDLNTPDILCLMEIQDDSGDAEDGTVSGVQTATMLSDAILEAGGPSYTYTEIAPEHNKDGGKPGANIRVGIMYREDRVAMKSAEHGDATTAVSMNGADLSLNPGRIDPSNSAFASSRKSLVAQFEFNGQDVFVIANHLCSKRGDDPVYGDKQPVYRKSEQKRHAQAQAINKFAEQIKKANPDAAIIALGDMNDFEFSETTEILEGDVLYNMVNTLSEGERVSYVYNGNSQVLDNIFVNNEKKESTEIDMVNINSEYTEAAGRVSDHDPVIIKMELGESYSYTDAESVQKATESLELASIDAVEKDFTLGQMGLFGTRISWSEEHGAIEIKDGKAIVTRPAQDTADADGTITATITKGEAKETKVFYVKVLKEETPVSIAKAKTMEGKVVLVEGTALSDSGLWGSNTFYIGDATGGIYVYDQSKTTIAAGDHLRVKAKVGEYSNEMQLSNVVEIVKKGTDDLVKPSVVTMDQLTEENEGKLVQINNVIITKLTKAAYGTTEFEGLVGDNTVKIRIDNRTKTKYDDFIKKFEQGDIVDITGLLGQYCENKQIKPRGIADIQMSKDLTAEAMVDAVYKALDMGDLSSIRADLTLPISSANDVAISWASSNTAVIDTNGAVTRPNIGEENATITLTATITKDSASKTKEFEITVVAKAEAKLSDLIISEYIEGGSYNKAIEIYNGTGAEIDLSSYSIDLYTGKSEPNTTMKLNGTLEHDSTYVIVNSQSDDALKAYKDIEHGVTSFNGNDSLVLRKGEVVVDSFGSVGNEPDKEWKVDSNSTKDHTLVRKSSVITGDTTINDEFSFDEWIVYPKNDFSHLGTHVVE